MLSMVEVFGRVFRDKVVHVCEAEVGVEVISLYVVFLVEWAFGHGALFVHGDGYFELFPFDAGYLFDPAGVCRFFCALVPVAHCSVPFGWY